MSSQRVAEQQPADVAGRTNERTRGRTDRQTQRFERWVRERPSCTESLRSEGGAVISARVALGRADSGTRVALAPRMRVVSVGHWPLCCCCDCSAICWPSVTRRLAEMDLSMFDVLRGDGCWQRQELLDANRWAGPAKRSDLSLYLSVCVCFSVECWAWDRLGPWHRANEGRPVQSSAVCHQAVEHDEVHHEQRTASCCSSCPTVCRRFEAGHCFRQRRLVVKRSNLDIDWI